jgi:hypothetical protein
MQHYKVSNEEPPFALIDSSAARTRQRVFGEGKPLPETLLFDQTRQRILSKEPFEPVQFIDPKLLQRVPDEQAWAPIMQSSSPWMDGKRVPITATQSAATVPRPNPFMTHKTYQCEDLNIQICCYLAELTRHSFRPPSCAGQRTTQRSCHF